MIENLYEIWDQYYLYIIMAVIILWLIFSVSLWGIFKKSKRKPMHAFIPVFQLFPLMFLTDTPVFFVALLFLPGINIAAFLFVSYRLSVVFEQKGIMKYGLMFFPILFYPLLGLLKFPYKPSEQIETTNIDTNILYNQLSNTPVIEVTREPKPLVQPPVTPTVSVSPTVEPVKTTENLTPPPPVTPLNPTLGNESAKVDIIDIDNEDETWQDVKKVEEEKKVVNINPLDNDPLFNPKAKPVKAGDLEHYKICPQCGAKLTVDATTCFLCGTKVG